MAAARYLLDTNIVSDLARRPHGRAHQSYSLRRPATLRTSIIVACEIEFGLQRSGSRRLRNQVELILATLDILPIDDPVKQHCGDIRVQLARQGRPISGNDLLIAAHARSLGLTLVTHKLREFARVPGLAVEDWLAAPA